MCRCNLVDVTWKTCPIKSTMSGSFPPISGSRGPRRRSALFQILSHLERIIIVRREGGEVVLRVCIAQHSTVLLETLHSGAV